MDIATNSQSNSYDGEMINRLFLDLAAVMPMKLGIRLLKWEGMIIGEKTDISRKFYVDRPRGISIGNNCFLNYGVHCYCGGDPAVGILIGNNVFIGPEVSICCASHEISNSAQRAGKNSYGSVIIMDGCWIGMRSVILQSVTIAEGCVIAAGSVVTKSTDPNGLYAGVPAKRIKDLL